MTKAPVSERLKCLILSVIAMGFGASAYGQTPPPQAAGYVLVFSDDFRHLDLSPDGHGSHSWYPGIYFQSIRPLAGEISAGQSGLTLRWDRSSGNMNTSIEGCAYDAGTCRTFRYGYFEARMKWDVTTGAWPAFWMITKQSVNGEQHVGEIDIFEGQGSEPNTFYGTVNEWYGPSILLSSNVFKNAYALLRGTDFSEWHTYGVLWKRGSLTWYFDDQPVGAATTPDIFDRQDFFIILGSQEGVNWTGGNLNGVTASSINLNVDWVHVFQSADNAAEPPSSSTHGSEMVVPKDVWGSLSIVLGAIGYAVYVWSIFKGRTRPHMLSWLVWGITEAIILAAQISRNAGPGAWATGLTTVVCFLVAALSVTHGEKSITRGDWISFLIAVAGIVLWYCTDNPLGTVLLISVVDTVAFYPTIRKSYSDPWHENATLYNVSALRSLISLFALENVSLVTALNPLALVLRNGAVGVVLFWRRLTIRHT